MKPLQIAAVSVALAGVLMSVAACSSAAPEPEAECLAVDASVGARIAEGASGVALTPGELAAVKSPDMSDAYLVAMTFDAAGGDTETGVWAVTDLTDAATSILAVDGMAQSFTVWPGTLEGQALSITEPGASDAIACLE